MSNMIYRLLRIIIVTTIVTIITSQISYAQTKPQVVINEFLIDPQPQSVELLNIGTESADISNWYIDDAGGTTYFTIPNGTVLYPNSCSVFSSDFNLNKSSADTVRLFDQTAPPTSLEALLIDSYSYKSSSGSGISFFRTPDSSNNWASGSATVGLFNDSKSSCIITPTQTPTSSPTPSLTPTTYPTIIQPSVTPTTTVLPTPTTVQTYDNIFISEAMVYPETGEHEWIELYNNNDFPVSLTNWYLDDGENTGSTPRPFTLSIEAKIYNTVELSSSIFNNDTDQVRLLDSSKVQKDSFEYSDPIQGKSLGRIGLESDSFCVQEATKNLLNSSCINPTPQPTKMTSSQKISPTTSSIRSINRLIETKPISPIINNRSTTILQSTHLDQGTVLGAQTKISTSQQKKNLVNLFAFNSISYSFLSLVSLFLKLKNSV